MEEVHRITKPGAKVFLGVPFWNSFEAWGDPTDERLFSEEIFEIYDPTTGREGTCLLLEGRFQIEKIVYCINPLKPLFRRPVVLPFRTPHRAPMAENGAPCLATYFCNVIHGLEAYLMRL